MDTAVETLVEMAKEGDKEALEEFVGKVQDLVYGLSLRMLANPFDAEDAAQEILVKVITHLDSFRGESKFTSWVYRIASNHLLTIKKSRAENRLSAFKDLENIVDRDLSELSEPLSASPLSSEQSLVSYEIMIGCSMAMLTCLNRDLRITFILGDVFEIKSDRAVYVLNISPANFRKRLSTARALLGNFMQKKCGLINPDNPCRCYLYVNKFIKRVGKDPKNLMYAGLACRRKKDITSLEHLQEMSELQRIVTVFRSHPDYDAPEKFVKGIKELVDSGRFSLFR